MKKGLLIGITWVMLINFLEWYGQGGEIAAAIMNAPHSTAAVSRTLRYKIKKLPVPFLQNQHHFQENVLFYAAFSGNRFFVNSDGSLVYEFYLPSNNKGNEHIVLKEQLIGAKIEKIMGDKASALKVNQLSVRTPSAAGRQIPAYERLDLGRIYDGIRCQLKVHGGSIEKIFRVEPGADPTQIRVQLDGAKALKLTPNGEIATKTQWGAIALSKPIAYQHTPAGRQDVAADYVINGSQYGFYLGPYDPTRELIIDPHLSASFLENLGEFGGQYEPFAMVSDAEGNLIIADSFHIRKISPNLDSILATSSCIPPASWIRDIALDSRGNLYIAGLTRLAEFPSVDSGSADSTIDNNEGFVAKVDADLNHILAATYLGGSGRDFVHALVIDSSGNLYAAGDTSSENFPGVGTRSADPEIGPRRDGFVVKLNPDLSRILSATYIGGSDEEEVCDIGLDSAGNVFVAGYTTSSDFPGISSDSADDTSSSYEGFVCKLDPALNHILAATYLGGTGGDYLKAMQLDRMGNVLVAGSTWSSDFPEVDGDSADSDFDRHSEGFVARLNTDLSAVLAATYMGGAPAPTDYVILSESVKAIAIDAEDQVWVVGQTDAPDFPGVNSSSVDDTISGDEAFIVKLDPDLAEILTATYLGGSSNESASAVIVPNEDLIYVAGETFSADFPGIYAGSADNAFDGQEGFVALLDLSMMAVAPEGIEEPPRRLEHESLFLIDCGPCPACFEGPCDPRVNPDWDKFVIWQPELEIVRSFSRSAIGLRAQDGPIAAAAPIRTTRGAELFVISVPYADAAKVDVGAVFFLDGSGKTVAKAYGRRKGERLGIDLAVYHNEVVAVSTRKIVRFENSRQIFEQPLNRGLKANQGLHVAFTADVDGDRKADIMLGAPFAKVGELEAAGLIQIVGSKNGQVVNTMYGRVKGQHLGKRLQPQVWNK